jgi:chemotaxis protein methyltransferase CheR
MRIGRFEVANGATIFLDEIGELPLELQPKLLRVIQDGEFERLGSSRTIKVDSRIIAATNRNLEEEVRKGRFRDDLWYRLNIFPITMPPLRDRMEDIPLLVDFYVKKISKRLGKTIEIIPANVMNALSWKTSSSGR